MSIPKWVSDLRLDKCRSCSLSQNCLVRFEILEQNSKCPKGEWSTVFDEIEKRAWPSNAPRISGCCDSALNYGE